MNHTEILGRALRPDTWASVSRALLAKMLSEFLYEEIIRPDAIGKSGDRTVFRLPLKNGAEYVFEARRRMFDSYRVIPESVRRAEAGGAPTNETPLQFVLDLQHELGLSPTTTAHFLRELTHTLMADAHILERKDTSVDDLMQMDYAWLEGEMEGHPWITFNKGRIGWGYDDYLAYAPEQKQSIVLSWIAVRKDRATYHTVPGLDYDYLVRRELERDDIARFEAKLARRGLEPQDYFFMPVHAWQWQNVIVPSFAEDVATDTIVPLGAGSDQYLPQQSIRTFVNISHPTKHHIKLPMSILNTLVYRGLPGERTVIAPLVTQYVKGLCDRDPFLRDECRLILLGEVASLNYDHPYYAKLAGAPYQYLEMLGCIWRESIYSFIEPGERPLTLAALLHVDKHRKPFVSALVDRSGLGLAAWLERLFQVVLPPLLHYLYRYGTVFSPHGENTILVLKDAVPQRLAMKDFVDDCNLSRHPLPELAGVSPELKAVLRSEPPEGLCQFIWAGLFICHLRYLADLLEVHHGYPERAFWGQVRQTILDYQRRFPELEERYRLFDLLAPSFTKLCLNRNRLFTNGYADAGHRPHAAQFGRVANALHEVAAL